MKYWRASDHAGIGDQIRGADDSVAVQVRSYLQNVGASLEIHDYVVAGIYISKRERVGRRPPFISSSPLLSIKVVAPVPANRLSFPVPAISVVGPLPPNRRSVPPLPPIKVAVPPPTTASSASPPLAVSVTVLLFDVSICIWLAARFFPSGRRGITSHIGLTS